MDFLLNLTRTKWFFFNSSIAGSNNLLLFKLFLIVKLSIRVTVFKNTLFRIIKKSNFTLYILNPLHDSLPLVNFDFFCCVSPIFLSDLISLGEKIEYQRFQVFYLIVLFFYQRILDRSFGFFGDNERNIFFKYWSVTKLSLIRVLIQLNRLEMELIKH